VRPRRVFGPAADLLSCIDKKGGKEATLPTRPSRCEGCLALLGLCSSRQTRFAACGRCAQTNVAKSEDEACCARSCKALCCSARPKGETNTRLGSLRIADDASLRSRPMRSEDGEVAKQRPVLLLGPVGGRRGAQGVWGRARSALRPLTSRAVFERRERSERSELGARPQRPEHRRAVRRSRTATVGSPFLCLLSFGEAKESESAVGTTSRRSLTQ
jgi:hypothetical protein